MVLKSRGICLRFDYAFWVGWLVSSSRKWVFSCAAVIFAASAMLTGCAHGIPDPGLDVDRSIKTASVMEPAGPNLTNPLGLDSDTFRDGETIANAVSSVQFSGKSIAWQNPATGSSGEILGVNEQRLASGALCRNFTALRTSYDGIRNYAGSACMNDTGIWRLTSFNPA
jgi:17 kDa outer membrane surface antigen